VSAESSRPRAVLETSFWVAAYRAEVVANCFDLFEMIVPPAVEAGIRGGLPSHPHREYPYATLFRHLRQQLTDPPQLGPEPLSFFGPGEADAIALAHHLQAPLLINEWRGMQHAMRLNVKVVTVPMVIVALRVRDVISRRAALRKLDLIEPITARFILREARQTLDVFDQ
jgi:hypothetical protein